MGHLIRLTLSGLSEIIARCGWSFQKSMKTLRDAVRIFRRV